MSNLKVMLYFKLLLWFECFWKPNSLSYAAQQIRNVHCAVRCDNLFYLLNVPGAMLLDSHFKLSRRVGKSLTFNFAISAVASFLRDNSCCSVSKQLLEWSRWWADQSISMKLPWFILLRASRDANMTFSVSWCGLKWDNTSSKIQFDETNSNWMILSFFFLLATDFQTAGSINSPTAHRDQSVSTRIPLLW